MIFLGLMGNKLVEPLQLISAIKIIALEFGNFVFHFAINR